MSDINQEGQVPEILAVEEKNESGIQETDEELQIPPEDLAEDLEMEKSLGLLFQAMSAEEEGLSDEEKAKRREERQDAVLMYKEDFE